MHTTISIYDFMTTMLNDDSKRQYLIETFGYGVRELRMQCLNKLKQNSSRRKSVFGKFKTKIYTKGVKELSLLDILYLTLRKLINIITLRPLFNLFKKKDYSL